MSVTQTPRDKVKGVEVMCGAMGLGSVPRLRRSWAEISGVEE